MMFNLIENKSKSYIISVMLCVLLFFFIPSCTTKQPPTLISLLGKKLGDSEVQRFIDNRKGMLDVSKYTNSQYCTFKEEGISFLFNSGRLSAIFLYARNDVNYKQYQGSLPNELIFTDHRKDVRAKLGLPSNSSDGGYSRSGRVPLWDKYYYPSYSVHLTYTTQQSIDLVTLEPTGLESDENNDIGKIGFIDTTGKIVIKPQFDDVKNFSEGLANVQIGDKWGYINKTGSIIIKPQYHSSFSFSEGLACVRLDIKWGYINKQGDFVIAPSFPVAYNFSEGLARVKVGSLYGFIDKKGNLLIKSVLKYASDFSEGMAVVTPADFLNPPIKDGYGYIDRNGEWIVPPMYEFASDYSDGLAHVKYSGTRSYIDKTGKSVMLGIHVTFERTFDFSEGLAAFCDSYDIYGSGKELLGYIDKTGKIIAAPIFNSAFKFSEGMALVKFGSFYDYIYKSGKMLHIREILDYASDFSEGLAAVQINFKYGFIDKKGNIVIEPQFALAFDFSEGFAAVKLPSKYPYLDNFIRARIDE